MAKRIFNGLKAVFVGLVGALSSSCSQNCDPAQNEIYKPDRTWTYQVMSKRSNGEKDSFLVKGTMTRETDQNYTFDSEAWFEANCEHFMHWQLFHFQDTSKTICKSKTEFIPKGKAIKLGLADCKVLDFVALPNPFANHPGLNKGSTITTEAFQKKTVGDSVYLYVKQKNEVLGKQSLDLPAKNVDTVSAFKSQTESDYGTIHAWHYFHPDYGFVKFEFELPNKRYVEVALRKVSF